MIDIINQPFLDAMSAEAAQNPRLRKNHNLHDSPDAPCNRLFNAIEPGSYVRPHRHLDFAKDESVVIIRGRLGVIAFDDFGMIVQMTVLVPGGESVAVNVPSGAFHTVVSLVKGTVFFEAKAGPYRPLTDAEFASWSPAEGSTEAADYLQAMEKLW